MILVGHSMGGIVAQAAAVHPMCNGCAHTLLSLAAPHAQPPFFGQPAMAAFYARLHSRWISHARWTSHHQEGEITQVSISAGERDVQVGAQLIRRKLTYIMPKRLTCISLVTAWC